MMSKAYIFKRVATAIAASIMFCSCFGQAQQRGPICSNKLDSPIRNFCEVTPNALWRGARPDGAGMEWLINNGVKTIINLELLNDDLSEIRGISVADKGKREIDYFRVKTWEPLYAVAQSAADEDVVHFLAVANQAEKPIYVHCRAGENRTGVMVAAYEIIVEGKTRPADIKAVLNEMASYKGAWSGFTKKYIESLYLRREEFLQKVKAFKVERPAKINCDGGKCE